VKNTSVLTVFFIVFLVKPHLGIKTLPHLPLTFARTSTIDTPHCPLDPCRLDRRNHPALDALQVHLVLSHPGGIRTLRQRAGDRFYR
jgi:hypothetical protein